jgi:tetratricopeptide (TPR) repeat protein
MGNNRNNGANHSEINLWLKLPELELTGQPPANAKSNPSQLPDLELLDAQMRAASLYQESQSPLIKPEVEDGEELAETLYELASLQVKSGNYKKAQRLLSHALIIVEDKLGSEHLATAQILVNLGTVHLLQNNYEYAERFLHRAILVLDEHPETDLEIARAFNNLSAVYNRLGEYGDGERCLQEALEKMESALSEAGVAEHPELVPILQNYAELLEKTDRKQQAAHFHERIKLILLNDSAIQAA